MALIIGTIELVGVLANKTSLGRYEPFKGIAEINLGSMGIFIVASFVGAWVLSVAVWKVKKYEARYSSGIAETAHGHSKINLD